MSQKDATLKPFLPALDKKSNVYGSIKNKLKTKHIIAIDIVIIFSFLLNAGTLHLKFPKILIWKYT